MTTKVTVTVEENIPGKRVSVCLASPESGQVQSGTQQFLGAGDSAEFHIHDEADLVVKEVDAA